MILLSHRLRDAALAAISILVGLFFVVGPFLIKFNCRGPCSDANAGGAWIVGSILIVISFFGWLAWLRIAPGRLALVAGWILAVGLFFYSVGAWTKVADLVWKAAFGSAPLSLLGFVVQGLAFLGLSACPPAVMRTRRQGAAS